MDVDVSKDGEDHAVPMMVEQKSEDKDLKLAGRAKDSPFKYYVKAAPVFELSSISICRDIENCDEQAMSSALYLYGEIKLIDDRKNEFLVFHQSVNDPDFVLNSKSAIIHKYDLDRPQLLLTRYFSVSLFLIDKFQNREIIDSQLLVNFDRKQVDYDVEEKCEFNTGYGLVTVRYTVFRCAILALVKFTVFKIGETDNGSSGSVKIEDIRVRGTILARCRVNGCEEITRVLFDSPATASFFVLNSPIELPPLAVPAYSSLKLEANLEVEGEKLVNDGDIEFDLFNVCLTPPKKDILGENWRIQVNVTWEDALGFLEENKSSELLDYDYDCSSSSSEESEDSGSDSEDISDREEESVKRTRLCPGEPPLLNVIDQAPISVAPQWLDINNVISILDKNWELVKQVKVVKNELQEKAFNSCALKSTELVKANVPLQIKESEHRQLLMVLEGQEIMVEQVKPIVQKSAALEHQQYSVTQLFELSSVTICKDTKNSDEQPSFAIYGQIKLIDDNKNEFLLFDKSVGDHPEFVLNNKSGVAVIQKLDLDRPKLLPKSFLLKLYLIDKTRNMEIINGELLLDFREKVCFDVEQNWKFNTGYGTVTVCYTIFRFPVLAYVELRVFKIGRGSVESDDNDNIRVRGTILARTGVKYGKEITRVLFDSCSTTTFFVNCPWKLPALPVPDNSSLKLEVELEVEGEKMVSDCNMEFDAVELYLPAHKKDILGENWRIQFSVTWGNAGNFLKENKSSELVNLECDFEDTSLATEGRSIKWIKRNELCTNQASLWNVREPRSLSRAIRRVRLLPPMEYANSLVEVFSVVVVSFAPCDDSALNVFGTIQTVDSSKEFTIFNKGNDQEPGRAYPNKIMVLEGLRYCHDGSYFRMHLDLKDALGHEIARGVMAFCGIRQPHLLDKRMCSVFSGEDGFAAVHYTMFKYAVRALIQARLRVFRGGGCCRVYGSIRAWYNNYNYQNHYEKNYYQISLFERAKSESMMIFCDADIPLLRRVVAVPADGLLIVEVDLYYLVEAEGDIYERLSTVTTFSPAGFHYESLVSTLEDQLRFRVTWH